jgi:hypothetical protein
MPSQEDILLEAMRDGMTITPDLAHALCGTYACHSVMARIRKRGFDVACVMNRNGRSVWGEYRLVGQTEMAL